MAVPFYLIFGVWIEGQHNPAQSGENPSGTGFSSGFEIGAI
jgi:hypothetical protein